MAHRTARVIYGLSLIPVCAVIFLIVCRVSDFSAAGIRSGTTAACLVAMSAVVAAWRGYVAWTVPQVRRTALISLLIAAHLLVWMPMWQIQGCVAAEWNALLCSTQTLVLFAGWCGGCAALWWWRLRGVGGRERQPAKAGQGGVAQKKARYRMNPESVRSALGVALLPLLFGLTMIYVRFEADILMIPFSDWTYFRANELWAALLIICWVLIWRRAVIWSGSKRLLTALLSIVLLAAPAAILFPEPAGTLRFAPFLDSLRYTSPFLAAGLLLAGTARAWRKAPFESAAQPGSGEGSPAHPEATIVCPRCGYSLRGLRETRCPECGWSCTVDEFVHMLVEAEEISMSPRSAGAADASQS